MRGARIRAGPGGGVQRFACSGADLCGFKLPTRTDERGLRSRTPSAGTVRNQFERCAEASSRAGHRAECARDKCEKNARKARENQPPALAPIVMTLEAER
jgi:hypothetical protein